MEVFVPFGVDEIACGIHQCPFPIVAKAPEGRDLGFRYFQTIERLDGIKQDAAQLHGLECPWKRLARQGGKGVI